MHFPSIITLIPGMPEIAASVKHEDRLSILTGHSWATASAGGDRLSKEGIEFSLGLRRLSIFLYSRD